MAMGGVTATECLADIMGQQQWLTVIAAMVGTMTKAIVGTTTKAMVGMMATVIKDFTAAR